MEFKIGGKVRLKKTIAYSEGEVPNGTICVLAKTSDLISEIIDPLGRKWTITTESIEPVILAIDEIISKEMSCVIHTKTKEEAELLADYMPQTSSWSRNPCDNWDYYGSQTGYYIADGKLAQYASISYYKANFPEYGEIYEFSDLFATGGRVSIHDIPTSEWYNPMRLTFKNGSSIEALPQKDDTVRGKNHFCDGFIGGKIPTPSKPVSIEEQLGLPKGVSIHDLPTSEWYNPMRLTFKNGSSIEVIPNEDAIRSKEPELVWIDKIALPTATETKEMVERVRREILKFTNAFPKEEKKLKFTFYVKEGTRPDKKCNGTIPTMTTNIELFDGNVFDKITTIKGSATCDKADYDERQGVLEALANAVCGGEFEKRYKKAVKANKDANLWMRTCYYCGKVFDTVEEKVAHDAWHVECKKARRERYLLRKRAKEIAFEEQAQKMAKEMMGEQK